MLVDIKSRTLKPQFESVRVNMGHPLARGLLLSASILSRQFDEFISDSQAGTLNTPVDLAVRVGSRGLVLQHLATDTAAFVSWPGGTYDFLRTNTYSLELWIYFTDGTALTGRNLCLGNADTNVNGIFVDFNSSFDNAVRFVYRESVTPTNISIDTETGSGVTVTNAWNHIVITYDGSATAAGVKGYRNGVPLSFTATSDTLTSYTAKGQTWSLGRSGAYTGVTAKSGTRYLTHRVWNRILTPSEISWLFSEPYAFLQKVPTMRYWSIPPPSPVSGTYILYLGKNG